MVKSFGTFTHQTDDEYHSSKKNQNNLKGNTTMCKDKKTDETPEYISIEKRAIGYDELVNKKLAARIIGVSPSTVRRLTNEGQISYYALSGKIKRYLVKEIIDWSESFRTTKGEKP